MYRARRRGSSRVAQYMEHPAITDLSGTAQTRPGPRPRGGTADGDLISAIMLAGHK